MYDKLTTNIKRHQTTVFREGTSLFNWGCAFCITLHVIQPKQVAMHEFLKITWINLAINF